MGRRIENLKEGESDPHWADIKEVYGSKSAERVENFRFSVESVLYCYQKGSDESLV